MFSVFQMTMFLVMASTNPTAEATCLPLMDGPPPLGYDQVERCPLERMPASFSLLRPARLADRGDSDILLIVASGLETPLSAELAQFVGDLESEGYNVSTHVMSGGTPSDLRSFLQGQAGIAGAILVGNLPTPWYEMSDWGQEEFPMDLYLMDLDGTWSDADGDGLLDGHGGDKGPEIWIGRIDPHAMEYGNEILMLKDYFSRNHLYRTGSLAVPARAVAFNDDDWSGYGSSGLEMIYSTVDVYNNPSTTTASYYRDRLAYGYEFVHLMSHSSPWGHTFKVPSGYSGTVMAPEIAEINPQTVFVQLFACSNARWTEPNCLGNWYMFGEDYGLLAIGSTKTGALLEFEEFYGPIGTGSSPGEAFVQWFNSVGIYNPPWHYGCVLLGDPTIMPLSTAGLTGALASSRSPGTEPTDYVTVSTSSYSDCHPKAAAYGDYTYIAWLTGQNGRLDMAARIYDGDSWSQVYVIDSDEYWDVTPSLCVNGSGTPYLAWADFDYGSYGYHIKVAYGSVFQNITTPVTTPGYNTDPDLAFTDRMWLVWQAWNRAEGDVKVRALDGSYPETFLTPDGTSEIAPTASGGPDGDLHVAWVETSPQGDRIMWAHGDQSGFSSPVELSSGDFCRAPCLGMAAGSLYLVWQEDDTGSSIRVRRYNGSSWESEQTVYSSSTEMATVPAVGESPGGGVFVAWQLGEGAGAELWQSTRSGSSWGTPALLVDPTGPAWLPALADGVIAWSGTGGSSNWDIYASLEGGVGVEEPGSGQIAGPVLSLLENPSRSTTPSLMTQGELAGGGIDLRVEVFDMAGRTMHSGRYGVSAPGQLALPGCSGLPSGIYVVRATWGSESWSEKLTVLR